MEDEKRRSGVKIQTRMEGMGEGGVEAGAGDVVDLAESVGSGGGWMWNLRTPTFSIRYSSRAEIHFWTLYVLYEGDPSGPAEMLRLHFQIRQPSAGASCLPSV